MQSSVLRSRDEFSRHNDAIIFLHAPSKEIQDSLGFWILRYRLRIPTSGFRILCHWNVDSGFQSLAGFGNPWAAFRIPKSRILDCTIENFPDSGVRIPLDGTISQLQSWTKVLGTILQYSYFSVISWFPLKTVHPFRNFLVVLSPPTLYKGETRKQF